MQVGEKAILYCASSYAYGDFGNAQVMLIEKSNQVQV
jgi:FKBP-type peptidyl-prolyl cis-trans isomerase